MLFRRTSRASTRHRRVLYDTLLGSYVLGVPALTRRNRLRRSLYLGKSPNYGDAPFLEVQARLTDLVPMHPLVLLIVFAGGLGFIAALEGAYLWMLRGGPTMGRVAALDLTVRGSLGTWFASAALALASLVALVVFSVRRYKLDDYHGHYRIWLWAAACWLLLSVDATANVHEAFGELMAWITGTRLFGESSIWWLVVGGFLVGGVGTRLLVDMRHCRISSTVLIASGACAAACIGFHFRWIPTHQIEFLPVDHAVKCVMLSRAAFLGGSFFVLLAMLLHARFVVLDAEGLLPRRRYPRRGYIRDLEALADQEAMLDGVGSVAVLPSRRGSRSTVVTPVVTPSVVSQPVVTPVVTAGSAGGVSAITPALPLGTASGQIGLPVQRTLTKQEKKALRERLERAREERERRAG